ncbi:MAG: MiaB/RimO family radical SAM methylthiotransferase, partial [Dehalococcoidales bacterium]|nr:MiaB/RimO family radical SAM methylthiotransferase [Dehalococcoidales bacterium]
MPRYHIWTIGCQMNKAESERLASRLEGLGYEEAASAGEADVIVVNSCVVRQSAENRVRGKLRELQRLKKQRPGILVAVTGCFVDEEVSRLKEKYPFVDHFFRAGDDPPWLEKPPAPVLPRISPRVYVPIIQGCDNFCTYCIVPYRRGRERSRTLGEIVCEVEALAGRGVKEVILLGQNVDSYGHDLPRKPDLADLLVKLNEIPGIERLRFLTNHPKDMSDKLIRAMASLDRVCEQISLPVQSGSDPVLKAMGRGYTAGQYRDLVHRIRGAVPGVAISTDVIVGFPGETEKDFQATLDLLNEL